MDGARPRPPHARAPAVPSAGGHRRIGVEPHVILPGHDPPARRRARRDVRRRRRRQSVGSARLPATPTSTATGTSGCTTATISTSCRSSGSARSTHLARGSPDERRRLARRGWDSRRRAAARPHRRRALGRRGGGRPLRGRRACSGTWPAIPTYSSRRRGRRRRPGPRDGRHRHELSRHPRRGRAGALAVPSATSASPTPPRKPPAAMSPARSAKPPRAVFEEAARRACEQHRSVLNEKRLLAGAGLDDAAATLAASRDLLALVARLRGPARQLRVTVTADAVHGRAPC